MSIVVEKACGNRSATQLMSCPSCTARLYAYKDGKWTEWICWRCGHYESDTPVFREEPHLYRDIVRKNCRYFLEKYAHFPRSAIQSSS